MKILVAGAAGFLGSHLVDSLLKAGHDVIGLDNLSTGKIENLYHHQDNPKFNFVQHDVIYPISLEIDQIYNLACPASPVQYQSNPIQTIKTSFLGSLNLLQLANQFGARILQASTSEVYGDPKVSPQKEDYWGNVNPIGVRSCYDEGKRSAETLFFDFHRQFQTEIRVARIFNTYGPRMDLQDGRVVSNFIFQALTGKNITIYGDGKQTRSFCFVSDLIQGLTGLMNSEENITGPINLGNPKEFTILELASKIIEITETKSRIVFEELPFDDPKQRKPQIEKAADLLNWMPRVELEAGLKMTINEFLLRIKKLSDNS